MTSVSNQILPYRNIYWFEIRQYTLNKSQRYVYLRHVNGSNGQGFESDENGSVLVTLSPLQHHVQSVAASLDEVRVLQRKRQLQFRVQNSARIVWIGVCRNLDAREICFFYDSNPNKHFWWGLWNSENFGRCFIWSKYWV